MSALVKPLLYIFDIDGLTDGDASIRDTRGVEAWTLEEAITEIVDGAERLGFHPIAARLMETNDTDETRNLMRTVWRAGGIDR